MRVCVLKDKVKMWQFVLLRRVANEGVFRKIDLVVGFNRIGSGERKSRSGGKETAVTLMTNRPETIVLGTRFRGFSLPSPDRHN